MSHYVAGVESCKKGWLVVKIEWHYAEVEAWATIVNTFEAVVKATEACQAVAVHMPIGLPDRAPRGGRAADREARRLLYPSQRFLVSPTPPRAVLDAATFKEATRLAAKYSDGGCGFSRRTYSMLPKIREVDAVFTPELQDRIVEVHPELCFRALNNDVPLAYSKRSARGMLLRLAALEVQRLTDAFTLCCSLARDDATYEEVLDAFAAAATAHRVAHNLACKIPDPPETDSRGLKMQLWR